jgi:hypothetical protein
MYNPKNTGPIVFIIVTSVVLYSLIRGKKLHYLGRHFRHHLISPSMKALRMKSISEREIKRAVGH